MRLSKNLTVGPGGVRCPCCFPAPGTKMRRYVFKCAKHKDRRDAFKDQLDNMGDDE